MKFGVALGALNPRVHEEATLEAELLGYESVWLPEHLVFTRAMSRSRAAGFPDRTSSTSDGRSPSSPPITDVCVNTSM